MAIDLLQATRISRVQKKKLKIVRVDKQDDPSAAFWFTVWENADTNIFSARDLDSYWILLEEELHSARRDRR